MLEVLSDLLLRAKKHTSEYEIFTICNRGRASALEIHEAVHKFVVLKDRSNNQVKGVLNIKLVLEQDRVLSDDARG